MLLNQHTIVAAMPWTTDPVADFPLRNIVTNRSNMAN